MNVQPKEQRASIQMSDMAFEPGNDSKREEPLISRGSIASARSEELREAAEVDFYKKYNMRSIQLLFGLFFFGNCLINVDHGALPAVFAQV